MSDEAHFSGHISKEELDAFDEAFGVTEGRSRSDALRECIRLGTRWKERLADTPYEMDDARAERMLMGEALRRLVFDEWESDPP